MKNPPIEKNLRILVVDDNRTIHDDFRKILVGPGKTGATEALEAALFGEPTDACVSLPYELDSAYQGKDGLEKVKVALAAGRPYAMAFLDVQMPPGWDGIETAGKIWQADPDVQIVLCTAYSDYSWEDIVKQLGQSHRLLILKKPFDSVEALQLASALTEKWSLIQEVRRNVEHLEKVVGQRTDELRKSEERYRLIAENSGDLIEIANAQGQSLYRSPSYAYHLGYSAHELISLSAIDLIDPEHHPLVTATSRACLEQGNQQVCDIRVRCKDGSWLTLESHFGPFRNTSGVIEGVLSVSRDVTDRRRLELQLRQAQKLESIGQLATGIAHEINTPTQYIGNNTRFLRDAFADLNQLLGHYAHLFAAAESGRISPDLLANVRSAQATADPAYFATEIPKAIKETLEGIERTARIVKALKNFAHPGTGYKTLVNLREVVDDALTITRNEWQLLADAITEFDATLGAVPVFPGEFSQVLLNLIINATHTIADKVGNGKNGRGVITLSTRADGEWAEIRVRDTGLGIPKKAQDRVFDPFFTTKPLGKGTGQGLSIARSIIVDKHSGSLSFETELGQGTVFIIRLPRHADS